LHIGEVAWALAPDASHDLVQGTDFTVLHALPGAKGLRETGFRGGDCTQHEQSKEECKIPHWRLFMLRRMNFA
jgi:hypothetical protein